GAPGDASSGADAATSDGGTECTATQHECDGTCTDAMANEPANGCRLGCGDPCPGGAEAICETDGTCGVRGCVPMTCEELSTMCGTIENGCGRRISCGICNAGLGQICEGGSCVCDADADTHEPNDDPASAPMRGSLTDDPDTSASITGGAIGSATDEDWFRYAVADTGFGGNPIITVTLEGAPAGADYAIAAYYACTSTPDASTCTRGTVDNRVGRGCTSAGTATDTVELDTECATTTDSGTLYVRVSATTWTGSCAAYTVRVNVR
ncbi:MAG: hypothetical protein M3Y87_01930, partial [Myxococcota bacterium]|nr:hypothetical protein [Myxococcota bacterium]